MEHLDHTVTSKIKGRRATVERLDRAQRSEPPQIIKIGGAALAGMRCERCRVNIWPAAAYQAHLASHAGPSRSEGRRCIECHRPVGLGKIGGGCARCEAKQARRQRAAAHGRKAAGVPRKTGRVREKLENIRQW